jgi:hypothetical protein
MKSNSNSDKKRKNSIAFASISPISLKDNKAKEKKRKSLSINTFDRFNIQVSSSNKKEDVLKRIKTASVFGCRLNMEIIVG